MSSSDGPGERPTSPFLRELAAVWQDPSSRRLARRRAGSDDLALDALDETFEAVARTKDPDHIENLAAFFRTALIHRIDRLKREATRISSLDPQFPDEAGRWVRSPWASLSDQSVEEQALAGVRVEAVLRQFETHGNRLRASVSPRSGNPARYQRVIAAVARQIVAGSLLGMVSDADSDDALRAAYPAWFEAPDCAPNTREQRRRRAREDVRKLLRTIAARDFTG
jgi:hypothetical protein